jgi:hypothetical protein
MNKEPDKYYKCIVVPLKMIIKHNYDHQIILENVIKCNKIIIYALKFIKLYCLHQYENTKTLPEINDEFIILISNLII